MKKISSLFFTIVFLITASTQTNAYQQLISINNEWQYQADVNANLKTELAQVLNEQQLIQFHLQETEMLLRNRNTSNLTSAQTLQRAKLLDILHNYSLAGNFPKNTLHQNRQPYFIDDFNTYCAVGYLMQQSGADNITREINNTQNYNYIADINHPKLMNWVQQSGFSIDELALIQPGYQGDHPSYITEIHYNNIGTDVNEYIEILDAGGMGFFGTNYDSVLFYNSNNDIYKKLTKSQLTNSGLFRFYNFTGVADSLADIGKIQLKQIGGNLVSEFIYSGDSVSNSFPGFYSFAKTFYVGENETTTIGNSLNFCGFYSYNNSLTASIIPNTLSTLNSCVITPINLSSFNSKIVENKIQLNWQTLTETDNNFFEVERSSDGKNFTSIGKLLAKKATNINNYTFIDYKPNYLNHYRLKQIDFDGRFTYSKILFVKMAIANPLSVLTNPAKNYLQVNISLEDSKLQTLVLYDLYGKKIKTYKAKQGYQEINVQGLAAGKYLLHLQTKNNEYYLQQVIVVKD
jgi:Secretion system C-terminal sorting domain